MIERFRGDTGLPRLIEALRRQVCIGDDVTAASALAGVSELVEFLPGEFLIRQDAYDNDVYFLLSGAVSVRINGRDIAPRFAGQHVGEMAVIDPAARRSADVIAVEPVVAARVSEQAFTAFADTRPRAWRMLACELANRLRQRSTFVHARSATPRLFVGSSREALPLLQAITDGLADDEILVTPWTDGVFGPSQYPLESLEAQLEAADFAALLVAPDDIVISRSIELSAPRDNVIFELGLFMGMLRRRRVFLISPRGVDLKIPSDLLGLTPILYPQGATADLATCMEPVCAALRKAIAEMGPR